MKVVDDVLNGGTEHLSSFRDRISDDRKKNSERFSAFKSTVKDAIKGRGWFQDAGATTLAIAAALFLIPGAIAAVAGIDGFSPVAALATFSSSRSVCARASTGRS